MLTPSRTIGMRPARSSITCAAVVGEGLPDRFADGAANGKPHSSMRARATGWDGMRTAIVAWPAVTASGTIGLRGRSNVKGPGQKASARAAYCKAQIQGPDSDSRALLDKASMLRFTAKNVHQTEEQEGDTDADLFV